MADTRNNQSVTVKPTPSQPEPGATHEQILAAQLPPLETEQPDPILQLSVGRLGAGSITLAAVACAIILSVVLYGLNSPVPNAQNVGTPPSPASAPAASGKPGPAAPNGQETGNTGHS
jgi:hypothetical protein